MVALATVLNLFVPSTATDPPLSAEAESGEDDFSFDRNQLRGSSRETNPFFCLAGSPPAAAEVETGAEFVTAGVGVVGFGGPGSESKPMSRADLMGSSSDKRTISAFGSGGLSLLAGGEDVASAARLGGGDVVAIVCGGEAAADCAREEEIDLLVPALGEGRLVIGAGGAGLAREAIWGGGLVEARCATRRSSSSS